MLRHVTFASAALGVLAAACGGHETSPPAPGESAATEGAEARTVPTATAEFQAAPDVRLVGSAEFEPTVDGVMARVSIANATPGEHGIHVHQKGDCSDIPGKSMGEHFAPEGNPHGLPEAPPHHLGDLGNIEVSQQGKGQLEIVVKDASLDAGPTSLLGKALVIHEKEDVGTGPAGESGKPIACAVIQAAP